MTIFKKIFLGFFALLIFTSIPSYQAQADFLFIPTRITFDDRDRSADLTIINTDDVPVTFRLEWLYQKQIEAGSYVKLDGPKNPEYDVGKFVIMSPRQVTIRPNGRQRVRFTARRPSDLPDGEYWAHILVKRLDKKVPEIVRNPLEEKIEDGFVRTAIALNVSVAVPLILRQGDYNSAAEITNPGFLPVSEDNHKPRMTMDIKRSGDFSTNGKVLIFWTPEGEDERKIGEQNNINIFTDINVRKLQVPLNVTQVAGGKIRVVYQGDGPDKGKIYDEKIFPIGG